MSTSANLPDCIDCPFVQNTGGNELAGYLHGSSVQNRAAVNLVRGELLFEEGDIITGIHCLSSGRVAIAKHDGDTERLIAVAGRGDVLGVPDILDGDQHRNCAQALDDASACFIPKADALAFFSKNPAILLRMMRDLCERIRQIEQRTEEYA